MEVLENEENGAWVLAPRGRIDGVTCRPFEQKLMSRIDSGPVAVVLDLAELDYLSSAGLRVLLMGAKRQKAAKAGFALCCVQEHIREVLDVAGFTQILEIHEDRSAALRALVAG